MPAQPGSPMQRKPPSPRTRVIAADAPSPAGQVPIVTPTVQSTTFRIDGALNDAMDRGDYRSQFLYTRMGNPTVRALEERLAELHHAEDAVCTASGMGALSALLFAHTHPGDRVLVASALYGVTDSLLDRYLAPAGRTIERFDALQPDSLRHALDHGPAALVLVETLTNPLVDAPDLPALATLCQQHDTPLAVDYTFPNPLVCTPIPLGATFVVESLSKSIAGHSDVHGGLVCGPRDAIHPVWEAMLHLGPCLDPHAATLVRRGLKTLALRTDAMQVGLGRIAEHLATHPDVARIHAPGHPHPLPSWLQGRGGMMSLVLRGGDPRALRFLDALRIIEPATSLGGVESLACLPFNTSHRLPASRERIGLQPGTVRLSVGCEDPDDLLADLDHALSASA
ncbi:MAG: aminotransferase class I/II-fold pyridoxal phosphate-dependent enzyme [Deltaproteobacteria bacterium]|nr:MAG: aminotransferase class I/II-fold pyridoxal phosphate-dependent enzyme [Deltaproteobacteria bacterium]